MLMITCLANTMRLMTNLFFLYFWQTLVIHMHKHTHGCHAVVETIAIQANLNP